TATAPCYDLEDSSIRVSLRLAYESGSQRSYITQKASRKLHLKPVGGNCMRITTFGSAGNNYQLSLRWLNALLRRLRQQPKLLEEYDKAIREQVEKSIVVVLEDPTAVDGETVHYLPAVIRHDKQTTKLRMPRLGFSLKESLYAGPKCNQHIFEILLRFRVNKYGFIADIEKALKRERDVLQFLCTMDVSIQPPEIAVMRFLRVAFGVTASPFLFNALVKHHIEQYKLSQPLTVTMLLRSIVMLAGGGFNLSKFICNREIFNANELLGVHKVLGVPWDVDND
uniref:Reverse transcriptase domain-containing protein n=1 Tax=Amphimedon queenslandica TaxID=400682 RepID=A0A1X7V7Z5_AMPQE